MRKRWVLRRRDFETSAAYRREFASLLARRTTEERSAAGLHELVFGELVTNAVRYGEEPMCVGVTFDDASLTIVTENAGPHVDLERPQPAPSVEGGRGLHIVRSIVSSLAVESTDAVPVRITATMPVVRDETT